MNGQTHAVDIEVTVDGEAIVEETRELDSSERTDQVGEELPDDQGEYERTVGPDSFERRMHVPGEQTEADCGTLALELLFDDVRYEFVDGCGRGASEFESDGWSTDISVYKPCWVACRHMEVRQGLETDAIPSINDPVPARRLFAFT